ncbi:hypothetical protein [Synechococcus sp. Cu2B8-bc1011]|uniref:hypothetical protein n=1 Tax=Synechococcus sp. Cu2B8-bc1011 TaxID=3093725 RepID=UPI0039AFD46B
MNDKQKTPPSLLGNPAMNKLATAKGKIGTERTNKMTREELTCWALIQGILDIFPRSIKLSFNHIPLKNLPSPTALNKKTWKVEIKETRHGQKIKYCKPYK